MWALIIRRRNQSARIVWRTPPRSRRLYGYPAIVVDFGTAVTFDIVSSAGAYIGGVIAPGLESMTSFLYQRTALLPKLNLREPQSAVGKTTREAMMAGAVFGYRGLVREIIKQIKRKEFAEEKSKSWPLAGTLS